MQKIAFTIFEIAKQAIQKNIPQDKTLQLIEHHVDKTYREAITELEKRGIISSEVSQQAASQSNIDDMAKQVQEQEAAERAAQEQAKAELQSQLEPQQEQSNLPADLPPADAATHVARAAGERTMKMKAIAMVLKLLDKKRAEEVLAQFSEEVANELRQLIKTPRLEEQVNMVIAKQCLEDLKKILPKKKKLSQDNMIREMDKIYSGHKMEEIEKVVKAERPFIKRFVSQSYEGDYYQGVPLRVAKLLVNYIKDNIKDEEEQN